MAIAGCDADITLSNEGCGQSDSGTYHTICGEGITFSAGRKILTDFCTRG
jgi:hypothetical protein